MITSSTVSGNSAGGQGGGVYVRFADLTVTSSTITGNRAGFIGGIRPPANISMSNSIVADNTDDRGSSPDLRRSTGLVRIKHSLIGDNTGSGLSEAPAGMPDENGNLIGDPNGLGVIDPLLGPLADNCATSKLAARCK